MATLTNIKRKNGQTAFQIQFILNKRRKTVSLDSRYTRRQAEEIKRYVEDIAKAVETGGEVKKATAGFIADMTDDLKASFVSTGLLSEPLDISNADLFDRFAEDSTERKQSTLLTYTVVKKRFLAFFPNDGKIRDITKRDGENWKSFLKKEGFAEASVAGSFKRMNALFNWAVGEGYLEANPFKGISKGSMVNASRMFFIPMDWYERLLDACPCQSWRTLLALCRIGGLRSPSETMRLTWRDVDWDKKSITVHSPKTEHHAGKDIRLIPMFPELKEELENQWEIAEGTKSPLVIPDLVANSTAKSQALANQFRRIIFRAGLTPWERLFQNLRESRANEIWSEYPRHIAIKWLGHTETVAVKHYLQVTDEQFQRALTKRTSGPDTAAETTAETTAEPSKIGSN
ncbi:MAG: site-specific integrase [Thermoguttaceae bacterium]|nr:site-specific integrase [Thermoguttaceae bacterium]